jgi:hypothetical protein
VNARSCYCNNQGRKYALLEGGTGGSYYEAPNDRDLADMWLLDLQTWNWTQVTPAVNSTVPLGSDGSSMQLVSEQNAVYKFGGCICLVLNEFDKSNMNCFMSTMYRLDLATFRWSAITPTTAEQQRLAPSARSFPSMTYQQVFPHSPKPTYFSFDLIGISIHFH